VASLKPMSRESSLLSLLCIVFVNGVRPCMVGLKVKGEGSLVEPEGGDGGGGG
jgi:hypothetical protein